MSVLHYDPEENPVDDAEVEVLTEYLSGNLTSDEEQEFEEQLARDEALLHRLAPLLRRCYRRNPLPIEIEAGRRLARRGLIPEPRVEQRRARRGRRRRLTGKKSR